MVRLEIMPCPFCGQTPYYICLHEGLVRHEFIECMNCGAKGPDSGRDRAEAIANWNARVLCPPGVQVRAGRIRPSKEECPRGSKMWDEVMTRQHQLGIGFDEEAYVQL